MNGWLVFCIYAISAVFGFCGGIVGYLFIKRKEKKQKPKTIVMDC